MTEHQVNRVGLGGKLRQNINCKSYDLLIRTYQRINWGIHGKDGELRERVVC